MIIPVHLYGRSADMDPINAIARKHKLMVLEDAAQAIGAVYKGRRAGSLGDAAALSFYPSKNLGGCGDGGMVMTDDPELGRSLARLRVHGMEPKYRHQEVGLNSRLDAIQAAVLSDRLRHLDDWTRARREAADRYRALFEAQDLLDMVAVPRERDGFLHVFNQYVVRVPAVVRDPCQGEYLSSRQIGRSRSALFDPAPPAAVLCGLGARIRAIFPRPKPPRERRTCCRSTSSSPTNSNGSSSRRFANSWIRQTATSG